MKLIELETQLRTILPTLTDRFTDWIDVSSYTVSSGVATIVTSSAHGLSVSDEVNIDGVVFPNIVTSLTSSLGIAALTTTVPMDANNIGLFPTVEVSGADQSDYNGTKDVLTYEDRKNLTYQIIRTPPPVSPATGTILMLEPNLTRYNGLFTVTGVTNTTTFTVSVQDIADFTASGTIRIADKNKHRIAAIMDLGKILDDYTEKDTNDWWLFVAMNDASTVSKDRGIGADFTTRVEYGEEYKQQTQEQFTILVFAPTTEVGSPIEIKDECTNELRRDLIATVCSVVPSKLFTNQYSAITFQSDQVEAYNRATYVHSYDFSTTVDLITTDTFIPPSIALNSIETEYVDPDNSEQINATDRNNFDT